MERTKESITGYFSKSRDVSRFENHLKTNLGSLYFAKNIGFEINYWMQPNMKFNAEAFNVWVVDQAMRKQIVIINSSVAVRDFTLNLNYTLAEAALQSNNYSWSL
ncbi:hypothetical protein IHC92_20795 [Photobacterium damselae subsp. damselae]|uniref:hypothetical protein n=1 Tax=Photobacterium damselae TaxID=38293 RepID=UPI001F457DAB|nr:hypothetical protein [Photobacterium damselae]UKA23393.1 hypothetical protein IHC92_20795 [Photobacterium damselae subsp. damselae]